MSDVKLAEDPAAMRAALMSVMGVDPGTGPAEVQPEVAQPLADAAVTVVPAASTAEPVESAAPVESPELVAMRAELESTRKKASESIEWGRKGYLRKSNELEEAKNLLKQAMSENGLSKEQAEAFLAGKTPEHRDASTGQFLPKPAPELDEHQVMDASQFVFDYGLNEKAVADFTAWLASDKSTVTQRDIVAGDHYSTLRHSYERYQASLAPSPHLAKAAASVARTQREAAKAASSVPTVALPAAQPEQVDLSKLTGKERVEQGHVKAWLDTILAPYRP